MFVGPPEGRDQARRLLGVRLEVQEALEEHPDVLEAAVSACPTTGSARCPVAVVRLADGAALDDLGLAAWAADTSPLQGAPPVRRRSTSSPAPAPTRCRSASWPACSPRRHRYLTERSARRRSRMGRMDQGASNRLRRGLMRAGCPQVGHPGADGSDRNVTVRSARVAGGTDDHAPPRRRRNEHPMASPR